MLTTVWCYQKTICNKCLASGMSRLWPPDVGISIEGVPPTITFLHLTLTLLDKVDECPISFAPAAPNADFATGISDFPVVSKIPPFIKTITVPRCVVGPYINCKFAAFDQIYGSDLDGADYSTALRMSELLQLDWPPRIIARLMITIGKYSHTRFEFFFRTAAKLLRHLCLRDLDAEKVFAAAYGVMRSSLELTSTAWI